MPRAKKIWKDTADIPANNQFVMSYPLDVMFDLWPKWGFGDYLKEYFTYFKGNFSQMVYPADEFDRQAEFLANKMIAKPLWAIKVIKQVTWFADQSMRQLGRIPALPLAKYSNSQLIKLLNNTRRYHSLHHGLGAGVSWHADADKERVTKAIMSAVEQRLKPSKLSRPLVEIFSLLTTPMKESFLQKEEKRFLEIAAIIQSHYKLKNVFIQSDLEALNNQLKQLDPEIYRRIVNFYKTYSPFTYQYCGPAFPLSDYLGRFQAFLRDGSSAKKQLLIQKKDLLMQLKDHRQLISRLKFNRHEKNLIKMAQELVYVKDYRKNALYFGMYCYEKLFKEIGRRYGLSVLQIQYMLPAEIIDLLKKGKSNADLLNQRIKESVNYWRKRHGRTLNEVYIGPKMKKFLKGIRWQKFKKSVKELKGTCAYPGKVRGMVKIVNLTSDMIKMEKGNIMVAHNTYPNLVPAMRKAAALVGAAGGLTCHTAIVAREMKIPCIVGVTGCDSVLKDGDRIEVDANQGIVRKI